MQVNQQVVPPRTCEEGLGRAFAFLGKRWNGVLIGTLASGPAGFAELSRAIVGISESVLSDRLNELARLGLLQRTVRAGPPVGVSYQLTAAGRTLVPVLDQLAAWAQANLATTGCREAGAAEEGGDIG